MNWKNIKQRLFWTVVQASGAALVAAQVMDIEALTAAAMAGLTAGIAFITLLARDQMGAP